MQFMMLIYETAEDFESAARLGSLKEFATFLSVCPSHLSRSSTK